MDYRLEPQDLRNIYDWMDGKEPPGGVTESAQRFFRLSDALRNALLKERAKALGDLGRANRRLDKLTTDKDGEEIPPKEFHPCGYDEEELLIVIMHSARRQGIRISYTRGIHILYLLYASRLVKAQMRLTINHPVANVRGPQFWKASKAVEAGIDMKKAEKTREDIAGRDPGLVVHIDNSVKKYGTYPCTEQYDPIARMLKESKPYKDAMPSAANGHKWNQEIPDEAIWKWRKSAIGL